MRIVRLANVVGPHGGALRTVLDELGAGYVAAGHEPVLVIPGATGRRALARLLEELAPDRLEAHDRSLGWTGRWARERAIPSILVVHDAPRRLAHSFDTIVCTSEWAAAGLRGRRNVRHVPLGVDLSRFHPDRGDSALRAGTPMLIHLGRRPERSIATLAELRGRGVPAVLVVLGDRPRRALPAGLPVRFLAPGPDLLARLLATADVALAPAPEETYGLAVLQALASGTPAVVSRDGALPEVIGRAGIAVEDRPEAYADAVESLLGLDRWKARMQAEQYGWQEAVDEFLRIHHAETP